MTDQIDDAPPKKGERIAKVMARAGLCSRRDAERWIAEGRVSVDGETLSSPALTVTSASNIIVDGKPLPVLQESRLWRYHKPSGLVTTHKDEKDRATVFQKLPKEMGRVISIGRLDLTTEGLLLLTNDGELARKLEMPSTGWIRRYRVRVYGTVDPKKLEALKSGVTVEGVRYGPIEAHLEHAEGQKSANTWLAVAITEGKNREIRKVMDHIGLEVTRLLRISYGPFQLGTLKRGEIDEVRSHAVKSALGDEKSGHGKGFAKAKPKTRSIKYKQSKGKPGTKSRKDADRRGKA